MVRNIAKQEGVSQTELDAIPGTGKDGRVTKDDILSYIENRSAQPQVQAAPAQEVKTIQLSNIEPKITETPKPTPVASGDDEIIEMTRMGKLIAHHMVESVKTSAHVQSFIEADVTKIWNWRNKVKDEFFKTGR